jgi:antitoxin component of MazEF toxin-antitoxin module
MQQIHFPLQIEFGQDMELQLRKLGNSTGLTLPPSLMRDLGLIAGQLVTLSKTSDGGLLIQPKPRRPKYTAAELNALCNPKAPMPDDLLAWDQMQPVGSEAW